MSGVLELLTWEIYLIVMAEVEQARSRTWSFPSVPQIYRLEMHCKMNTIDCLIACGGDSMRDETGSYDYGAGLEKKEPLPSSGDSE